jgi:hypothetical protein
MMPKSTVTFSYMDRTRLLSAISSFDHVSFLKKTKLKRQSGCMNSENL